MQIITEFTNYISIYNKSSDLIFINLVRMISLNLQKKIRSHCGHVHMKTIEHVKKKKKKKKKNGSGNNKYYRKILKNHFMVT